MGGVNDYTDNIIRILGGGHDASDYRTQAEQDALVARGVTKTRYSSHTQGTPEKPNGIDVGGNSLSQQEATARLRANGFPNAVALRETGVGANQGTGPHLHITLDTTLMAGKKPPMHNPELDAVVANAAGVSPSGSDTPVPPVLREQGSTTLPGGPGPATLVNPFDVAQGALPGQMNTTMERAQTADAMLSQIINVDVPASQAAQIETMKERNDTVHAVNDDITNRTNQFLSTVKPLIQQKEAVADRYRQVSDMNPLERGFMSLFDASYDKDHLRDVDAAIGNQLKTYGEGYQQILEAQNTLLHVADTNFTADQQMNLLQRGFIDEKLDLASKSFAAADTIVTTSLKQLAGQSQILAAQNQLADQVITSLTPGQRATALDAAKKNPDKTVTIQGAKFTEGQLLSSVQADAKQQVALDEMVLSRQTAQMNNSMTAQRMADQAEDRLIGSLTTAQTRSAIQNGGMWQGHQLSLDKLGSGLQSSIARDNLVVGQTMQDGSTRALSQSVQGMSNQMKLGYQRSLQLLGVAPPELTRTWGVIGQEIQQITDKITAAPVGQADALSAQYAPRLQQLYQLQQKAVDDVAIRWAGGNKKLLPLAQAFLTGSPLNSSTAVQGLIEMARTNGSFGGGMSGPAADALAIAKQVVAADAKSKSGTDMASMMASPESRAQHEQELQTKVSQAISQTYANSVFHRVLTDAPAIAKQIDHPGQHLDNTILHEAQTAGDSEGLATVAAQLNLSPAQAKQMFSQGSSGPLWAQANHKDAQGNELSYGQWASTLQVAQLQHTYRILDAIHPKIGQFKAGQVYANLLGSSRFAQSAGQLAAMQGQASFGDSIMASMGTAGLQGQVAQFGQIARSAYSAMGQRDLLMRVASANRYGNDPMARTTAILGAIKEINPAERQQLMTAIKQTIQQKYQGQFHLNDPADERFHGPMQQGDQDFNQARSNVVADIIKNQKFQDPALERIRQRAAKQWDTLSHITDSAVDALGTYQP